MSGVSGSYNAVTWLLDRNVDEGRGAKFAFTDTVSDLTYGDLQKQSRRVANMLRRLGVRRPVNWQQRTPHPPNDWKQSIHA